MIHKPDYIQVKGWESSYKSMKKLLNYLENEKTSSIGSRQCYCISINAFCRFVKKNPDELLQMEKKELEEKISEFLHSYSHNSTANSHMYNLRTFFKKNGLDKLEMPHFYQSKRGGKIRGEYIPTVQEAWKMADCAGSLKSRFVIIILFTTGLRNSTLRALKYGEIKTKDLAIGKYNIKNELDEEKKNPCIVIYPEMKDFVPDACKGKIPYYVFMPKETTEVLQNYLNERTRRYGAISGDEFLIPSERRRLPSYKKLRTPITPRAIEKIVQKAAFRAGIKDWDAVRPHGLRKTFRNIITNQPKESELSFEDREFFMGHVLPGSVEAYYDSTKIEEMRAKFAKLYFRHDASKSKDEFLEHLAHFHGIDYQNVVEEAKRRKGRNPNKEEIRQILREAIEKSKIQKSINESELDQYIKDGWNYVANLPSGKIMVNKITFSENADILVKDIPTESKQEINEISESNNIDNIKNTDVGENKEILCSKKNIVGQLSLYNFDNAN